MKILIVDPDQARAPILQELFTANGAEVSVAPSGSFALTMLEWNKQDIIVSRARIDDMDGHELCSLMRSDPSTKDVRFVLIASAEEAQGMETAAAGIDLVLPSSMTGSMIVPLVVQLARHDLRSTPAPDSPASVLTAPPPSAVPAAPPPFLTVASAVPAPRPVTPPPPAPQAAPMTPPPAAPMTAPSPPPPAPAATTPAMPVAPPPPRPAAPHGGGNSVRLSDLDAVGAEGAVKTFQGSLGVMEMEELVQAISMGGKTGRLLLVLAAGGGMIVFNSGRVVHAEFGPKSGEPAFAALVSTAHRERAGKFCFIPSDGRAPSNGAATISMSTDQLLLSIATAMDEEK